jgi:hypothetical protein
MNEDLYSLFARLTLMANLFGHDLQLDQSIKRAHWSCQSLEQDFSSLEEARDALFQQLVIGHEFTKGFCVALQSSDSTTDSLEAFTYEQERLILQQQAWYERSRSLCQILRHGPPSDACMAAALTMWHTAAMIWLRSPPEWSQMPFDTHLSAFRTIVEQAQIILTVHRSNSMASGVFIFEMGVIPPLYFTALKCRHFWLRNQALELLRKAPEREGLWKRDELVTVAEKAIELESGEQTCDSWLPPEADRILNVKILQQDGARDIRATFTYSDYCVEATWGGAGKFASVTQRLVST